MRIRQIVFAAHDLAAARTALARLLGLPQPYRDPGVAEFGLDNAVFCFGDQFIEVVSPVRPDTTCGRHLARQGGRAGAAGYMLILQTDDFDREAARVSALGVRRIWHSEHPDIRAMHLHPKDVGGAIVSIDQPLPAAAWRWGGPDWQVQPGAAGAQRVRGIALRAAQPQALAERWAQVFGLAAPQPDPQAAGAWRLALDGAWVQVLPAAPDQAEGVAGFTLAVTDPVAVLAQARALGLTVQAARGTQPAEVALLGTHLALQPLHAG